MTIQFLIIFYIISLAIFLAMHFGRVRFRNFLEKISPFPILREKRTDDDLKLKDITYEAFIIKTFIWSVILSIVALFASEVNFYFNIGFSLVIILPPLFLLLRIKTFSDSNILPKTNRGYNPGESYILSILGGFMGLAIGFSSLNFDYTPISFPIIMISGALFVMLIPIFPDYINKFLDYDIRSERGANLLRYITATGIFILGLIFLYYSLVVFNYYNWF